MPTDLDAKGLEQARKAAPKFWRETADANAQFAKVIRAYLSALQQIDDAALLAFARAHDREEAAQRGEPDPWPEEGTPPTMEDVQFAQERLAAVRVGFTALSALPPPCDRVGVKELDWEQPDINPTETSCWLAHGTDFCQYYVGFKNGSWWSPFDSEDAEEYPTIEAAKAAAQSDYARRIRSALTAVAAEPVAWIVVRDGKMYLPFLKSREEEQRYRQNNPDETLLALYASPVPAAVETGKAERLARHLALESVPIDDRHEYDWAKSDDVWRRSWLQRAQQYLNIAALTSAPAPSQDGAELVERLMTIDPYAREKDGHGPAAAVAVMREAASEIESLRARLAEVEGERDAAKDEAVNFVFDHLAKALGLEQWTIQDGSETWDGDVAYTLMTILRQSGAIDPETDEPAAKLARETLKYCEGCWAEERGTMIDKIQAERARATSAEKTVRELREGLEPFAALIVAMDRDNVEIGRSGNDDPNVSDAEVAALVLPDNQVMVSQGTLAFGRPGPRPESKKVYASDFRRARSLTERRDG